MNPKAAVWSFTLFIASIGMPANPAGAQGVRRPATDADVHRNGWLRDYREAVRLAKGTGRPIMALVRCVP